MANVVSAGSVIATIFFVAPLLYYLPRAVLSAVVITAVAGLIKPHYLVHLWKTNRYEGIFAGTTFALSTD